jgi:carbon monoxide dehydrogenase subunit G
MRFSGTERIPAPRQRVWDFLVDPQAVAQCVPDVEALEVIDPSRFKAQVKAGIGPVRGKFGFDVVWKELTEPNRARMAAQGKSGGSAVTVDSTMDLADAGDNTTDLTWTADVVAHGLIASVGARLLDGFAKKQSEQFFGCIRQRVTGDG